MGSSVFFLEKENKKEKNMKDRQIKIKVSAFERIHYINKHTVTKWWCMHAWCAKY